MIAKTVEIRKQNCAVRRPRCADMNAHADADRVVTRWTRLGDLLIVGLAVATVVALSGIAQGNWHPIFSPRLANAPEIHVAPVIQAWQPAAMPALPIWWPVRYQQWQRSPHAAILTPMGIEVVEQANGNLRNVQWSSTTSEPEA